jgi:hypothetical protein
MSSGLPRRITASGKRTHITHLFDTVRLQGRDDLVSVRIGDHYRALGALETGVVIWIWIGRHAEYDQLTRG